MAVLYLVHLGGYSLFSQSDQRLYLLALKFSILYLAYAREDDVFWHLLFVQIELSLKVTLFLFVYDCGRSVLI